MNIILFYESNLFSLFVNNLECISISYSFMMIESGYL